MVKSRVAEIRKKTKAVSDRTVIRFGGYCLAGGAVAFIAVFSYLAARFNYPDVLNGWAETVLPVFSQQGSKVARCGPSMRFSR
jgi:hypothetical protein